MLTPSGHGRTAFRLGLLLVVRVVAQLSLLKGSIPR
jgi:hypothetical protein